ncbi:hypothetical protein AAE478_008462 [Parahypoxylon ruwenzoriense]
MEQPIKPQARAISKPNKTNYACEACRISKIKCQSGSQPGICKRGNAFFEPVRGPAGLEFLDLSNGSDADVPGPPPGPSKTFSIDFPMPAEEDPRDNFENLRQKHERYLENLVPSSGDELDDEPAPTSPSAGASFSFNDPSMRTPSSTATTASARSRPMSSLSIKPQFNLDSAKKLLDSFRSMLPHCPCIVLPDDADVRCTARDMPFVLLAILAVTSCSTSLQGHSLYDEEFRKILGLKFVAGSERSLELLQGLVIYCNWYPFHLRPKNRQMLQYQRMAVDIVHDLELDQETDADLPALSPEGRAIKLQGIRAFLCCFYIVSVHSWAWSKPYSLKYTSWMAKCCDTLEQHSELEEDHILAWLVRLQYVLNEFEELQRGRKALDAGGQIEYHRQLIRIGLETQLRDFQTKIPGHLSTKSKAPSPFFIIPASILIASLTADAYVLAAPLMRAPHPRSETSAGPSVDAAQLHAVAYTTRALFDFVTSLSPEEMGCFCNVDTSRFIVAVILAYRLSFPMPTCPGYDYIQSRKVLDFGTYLAKMSDVDDDEIGEPRGREGPGEKEKSKRKRVDAVTALKVVLRSVKAKYEKKSAALDTAAAAAAAAEEKNRRARMCPMFDGSLDQYLPLWEGQQGDSSFLGSTSYPTSARSASSAAVPNGSAVLHADGPQIVSQAAGGSKPALFHDLWATMTMGWAADANTGLQEVYMADVGVADDFEYVDLEGI